MLIDCRWSEKRWSTPICPLGAFIASTDLAQRSPPGGTRSCAGRWSSQHEHICVCVCTKLRESRRSPAGHLKMIADSITRHFMVMQARSNCSHGAISAISCTGSGIQSRHHRLIFVLLAGVEWCQFPPRMQIDIDLEASGLCKAECIHRHAECRV